MNEKEAWEVFDGLMLGDGGMRRYKNTARFYMNMSKHTISIEDHLKYEYWLRDNVFATLGIRASVSLGKQTNEDQVINGRLYKGKTCLKAHLFTESIPLLAEQWDKWYIGGEWAKSGRNTYIRDATLVLPEWIIKSHTLPTCSLTHWALGDGGSSRPKGQPSTVYVRFSAHCFSEGEVHHLIAILSNMGISTTKSSKEKCSKGSGLTIQLAQESADYFVSLIEPHVLEIFSDSVSPSYKDIIKYKNPGLPNLVSIGAGARKSEFNSLRSKLVRS